MLNRVKFTMEAKLLVLSFLVVCFHLSICQTVSLDPGESVTSVCPNEIVTISCRTTGGALVWTTTNGANYVFNGVTASNTNLGIFRLTLNGLHQEGTAVVEVNSSATTLVGFRPEDDNTTLSCLTLTVPAQPTPIMETTVLKLADPPQVPTVDPITLLTQQQQTSYSSILISWSMSDCAVQYVVTIISSDGSVYPNITTSDTNTTVTLPNGVEYCVTVAAVDAIGRRGLDSVPSCYAIPDTPTPSLTVDTSTSPNQPLYPVTTPSSIVTGTLSPTQSPGGIDGISVIAVVAMVIGVLVLVIAIAIVITVLLFRQRNRGPSSIEDTHVHSEEIALPHLQEDESHSVSNGVTEDSAIPDQLFTGLKTQPEASITTHASNTSQSGSVDPDQVSQSTASQDRSIQNPPPSSIKCFNQVFYQLLDRNNWKIIFSIFPEEHQNAAVNKFSGMEKYGETHAVVLDPNETDNISINISSLSHEWTKQQEPLIISGNAVQHYDGNAKPPHCVMIVEATVKNITPSDLSFTVNLDGLQDPYPVSFEAQTVTDCIAQIFYYPLDNTSINCWKAKCAFFHKKLRRHVRRIFQDANTGSHSDKLNFSGGKISASTTDTAGWTVTLSDQHTEVRTAEMERYDGHGEPPYIELILKAVSDDPPNLSHSIALTGVKSPTEMPLTRLIATSQHVPHRSPAATSKSTASNTAYTCQVFYHRVGVSQWKATFAFFPSSKLDRVQKFYQDANIGPTTDFEFKKYTFSSSTTIKIDPKPSIQNGWKVHSTDKKEIKKSDLDQYTGAERPPFIEVKIEPISHETIPSVGLEQGITLIGVTPSSIIIERASDNTDDNISLNSDDFFIVDDAQADQTSTDV